MKMILLLVYHFILLVGDENRVETRLQAIYVQILSTPIGHISFRLSNDAVYDLCQFQQFCVDRLISLTLNPVFNL